MRSFLNLFAIFLLLGTSSAFAEIESVSIAAKIKSFDANKVVLEAKGRTFEVSRQIVRQKTLHSGDLLIVKLEGKEEIGAYLEPKKAK